MKAKTSKSLLQKLSKYSQFGLQENFRSAQVLSKIIKILERTDFIEERSLMAFSVLETAVSNEKNFTKGHASQCLKLFQVNKDSFRKYIQRAIKYNLYYLSRVKVV